jgi:hypothetical protein
MDITQSKEFIASFAKRTAEERARAKNPAAKAEYERITNRVLQLHSEGCLADEIGDMVGIELYEVYEHLVQPEVQKLRASR